MLWFFLIVLIFASVAGIGAWRARQRMGKALGRKVGDSELTSLRAWNEISEAEKDKKA